MQYYSKSPKGRQNVTEIINLLGQYFQIHTHICTGIYTKGWAEENSRRERSDQGSA